MPNTLVKTILSNQPKVALKKKNRSNRKPGLVLANFQRDTRRCGQENIGDLRLASNIESSYDRKAGYFFRDSLNGNRNVIWHFA